MVLKYRFLSLILIVFMLMLPAAVAFGGGYSPDSEIATTTPHGGYVTTSNKCKACHAVHRAESFSMLLRPEGDNLDVTCEYCHGETGITPTKKVWLDANGHGIDASQTALYIGAPDDTTNTMFRRDVWGCIACHTVHGNTTETVILSEDPSVSTSALLRKFPNGKKPLGNIYYTGTTGTLNMTAWCSNCHEVNFGLHTEDKTTTVGIRYSHDSSTAGYQLVGDWVVVAPDDTSNTGPTCRQCHTADRAPAAMNPGFPHAGGDSWKMLKSSSTTGGTPGPIEEGKLDKLCAGKPCHQVSDLP